MKNKFFIFIIILFLIGFNVSGSFIKEEKSNNGSSKSDILFVGGSGQGNYSTIQDAIDNSSNGNTIFVFSGFYNGGLIIEKSIKLHGENRDNTYIDGTFGLGHNGISILSDGVHVTGFTIQNVGNFWPDSAIYINSDDNVIYNNKITNNKFGIDLFESENTKIYDNLIFNQNRYDGIYVEYSSFNIISNNLISDNNGRGILIVQSNNNTIINNYISNNDWGGVVIIDETDNGNIIYHNNFYNNNPQNGWDLGLNIWDDNYPSGGNFWDDYDGSDENGDGIGDTEYNISGGNSKDNYPLINPYISNYTKLEIVNISFTPFNLDIEIKNIGNFTAHQIDWNIKFDGGFLLFNKEKNGYKKYIFNGESFQISFNKIIGFGKSKITIVVDALNANKIENKFDVFLFFVFIIII